MHRRLSLTVIAVLMALALGRPAATEAQTTLAISGRQLLVNGQPFTVRGVNYKPTPYTGVTNWGDDWTLNTALTAADLAKMQEMGANTIRVYVTYERLFNNWDNHDPGGDSVVAAELSRYQTALAQAQSRGIYVIMSYWLPHGLDYNQATNRTWHQVRFRKIINTFKSLNTYPNVLMWAFGNENNLNRGALSQAQLFAYYGEAISEAKAQADASHPYTVVLGDDLSINNSALTGSAAAVDIWSLNLYQTAQGYSNIIGSYGLSKPLLFTEFGADAYNTSAGSEDQASQASFYTDRWSNYIRPNLSATSASNKLLGGVVFEWNDEWWKAAGANNVHDTGGWAGNVPPDNFLNEEWFGLGTALPEGSSGPRSYRQAFSALKTLWAAAPTATATPPACTVGATCQAESAVLGGGVVVSTQHAGYTGSGFADYAGNGTGYVEWTVTIPTAGSYSLGFRYANGGTADRPMSINVNGTVVNSALSFPVTGWTSWSVRAQTATLPAGSVKIRATESPNGPNVDSLTVTSAAATPTATATSRATATSTATPTPRPRATATTTPRPTGCAIGATCEAETALLGGGVVASTLHAGYTGSGFADYQGNGTGYVEWTVSVLTAGTYSLSFRYANGGTGDRPMSISVNGTVVNGAMSFPVTGWTSWTVRALSASLPAGSVKIRATENPNGPNVDNLTVSGL